MVDQREEDALAIRAARLVDVPMMVALERRSFAVHQMETEAFRRLVGRDTAMVLVCERGGRFLGHAVVLFRARTTVARLYSIAILPEARGTGAGRALLSELVSRIRERGLATVSLEVRSLDTPVRAFYERFGFSFKETLPGYYDDGADAVRLVFELAPALRRPLRLSSRS